MNSKGHLYISLLKSAIRLTGVVSALCFGSIVGFVILIGTAEVLGIVEELLRNWWIGGRPSMKKQDKLVKGAVSSVLTNGNQLDNADLTGNWTYRKFYLPQIGISYGLKRKKRH